MTRATLLATLDSLELQEWQAFFRMEEMEAANHDGKTGNQAEVKDKSKAQGRR